MKGLLTDCLRWHIDPRCGSMLFGHCHECGDLASAVIPSVDYVGMVELGCQHINDVNEPGSDGCGWKCELLVDVPKRKASLVLVREVCSR